MFFAALRHSRLSLSLSSLSLSLYIFFRQMDMNFGFRLEQNGDDLACSGLHDEVLASPSFFGSATSSLVRDLLKRAYKVRASDPLPDSGPELPAHALIRNTSMCDVSTSWHVSTCAYLLLTAVGHGMVRQQFGGDDSFTKRDIRIMYEEFLSAACVSAHLSHT
jgi:hypothetical protein